jgi:hypothetical protein
LKRASRDHRSPSATQCSRIAIDGRSVAQFVDRVRKKPSLLSYIMLVPKRLSGAQTLVEWLLEG